MWPTFTPAFLTFLTTTGAAGLKCLSKEALNASCRLKNKNHLFKNEYCPRTLRAALFETLHSVMKDKDD